ncbi:MAG: toll/interleukin-1 receptor domain-containing protein [Planctomycetes bacterium]|nr:toll/interleukin-1 receptor domain-containing protein [Planctomycetota bacterium]
MNPPQQDAVHPPFEAYSGDEPYLFVSYAHKDAAAVYPELKWMHGHGYRVWYDEGIDPGNEWPEEIAKALHGCSMFLVFISPRAVVSKNVRNEINYAINHDKPFLAVYLEETELPRGLELRMGDIQAIVKYRMPEDRYHRQLQRSLPHDLGGGIPEGGAVESQPEPAAEVAADTGSPKPSINRETRIRREIWKFMLFALSYGVGIAAIQCLGVLAKFDGVLYGVDISAKARFTFSLDGILAIVVLSVLPGVWFLLWENNEKGIASSIVCLLAYYGFAALHWKYVGRMLPLVAPGIAVCVAVFCALGNQLAYWRTWHSPRDPDAKDPLKPPC